MKKLKNPKKQRQPKNREKEVQKWNNIQRSTQRAPFELCLRVLISALFLIIFLLFASLDTSGTWHVNRPATKTSTWDTYLASSGSEIFILAKNLSQDPLFVVIGFLSILSTSSEFSIGHAFHLFKLIFAFFLIIFLLYASLDTSGTWNMNRPATKTSTRDTYSAPPVLETLFWPKTGNKILFSWSQAFCQF